MQLTLTTEQKLIKQLFIKLFPKYNSLNYRFSDIDNEDSRGPINYVHDTNLNNIIFIYTKLDSTICYWLIRKDNSYTRSDILSNQLNKIFEETDLHGYSYRIYLSNSSDLFSIVQKNAFDITGSNSIIRIYKKNQLIDKVECNIIQYVSIKDVSPLFGSIGEFYSENNKDYFITSDPLFNCPTNDNVGCVYVYNITDNILKRILPPPTYVFNNCKFGEHFSINDNSYLSLYPNTTTFSSVCVKLSELFEIDGVTISSYNYNK